MSQDRAVPRLLLVEDDQVSRMFLLEALSALPATVSVAEDIAQATALVGSQSYDLWLIDAHLPDGDGLQCLQALRRLGAAPALAITAGASRETLDGLCSGGFVEVLLKPVSISLLHGTVRRLLGEAVETSLAATGGKLPVWDEQRALAAIGGNRHSLMALRAMFLKELPIFTAQLQAAQEANDRVAMAAVLHKLKASCGFVGAARLAEAGDLLAADPLSRPALQRFQFAATDALDWSTLQP